MTTLAPTPQPRLVTPNPEIHIAQVDEDLLVKSLDDYDFDFGGEDEQASILAPGTSEIFPMEVLSKMTTLTEMVNYLPEQPKTADEFIAEAMQSLSLKEREEIVRDLYGIEKASADSTPATSHVVHAPVNVGEEPKSDPEFLETKLLEFEQELQTLRKAHGWNLRLAALELAEAKNLEYTKNRKFRLQFLRTDRFDATKAAARFIRHFDWKLELFGEAALARDIRYDDLTKEDQAMLKKGYLQRLPVRDRAGRAIFCAFYAGQTYESSESMARQWFYLLNNDDEETDRNGYIGLFFKIKDISFKRSGRLGSLYIFRFCTEFPLRFVAMHKFIVNEQGVMGKIMNFAIGLLHPDFQARTRVHVGSFNEWVTQVMSFGVPHDVIPCTPSCKIKTKNHMEYINMRIRQEEILATTPGMTRDKLVDLPSRRDVLLGKGRPIQFSSGNQALGMIVDGYLDQYHKQCSKLEKTALANDIIRMVQSNGVRFLSKENGIWMEVSNEVARDKISHMFRHQKKKCITGNTATTRDTPDSTPQQQSECQEQTKRARVED